MDKTDRLRDYGLAFLLYEQGLGVCGYELIRELFIFVKLILNSYLQNKWQFIFIVELQPNLLRVCLNATNSHRAPYAVRSDPERDPIGHRTQPNRTADGI